MRSVGEIINRVQTNKFSRGKKRVGEKLASDREAPSASDGQTKRILSFVSIFIHLSLFCSIFFFYFLAREDKSAE